MAPRRRVLALGAGVALCAAGAALNYAAGLSRIRLRDFAAGIALGGSPRVVAYALLGGSLLHPTSPAALTGLALLAGMTLGTPAVIWLARRRLLA